MADLYPQFLYFIGLRRVLPPRHTFCPPGMADARAKGPPMHFGSGHPSLFSTGCADPREYVGAPVPRRSLSVMRQRTDSGLSRSPPKRPHTSMSAPRDGMGDDGTREKTLLNMDCHRRYNPKYGHLTSPRSILACRRLGLTPEDLMVYTRESCIEKMLQSGEDVKDPEVVKRRLEYLNRRRDQKYEAALRQRESLVEEEAQRPSAVRTTVSSTVLNQERQLQKIVDASSNRLKQQLLHHEVLERQREKEAESRAKQRKHDERQREQQRLLELEKSRKEEEAQRLRTEMKDLQRREAAAAVEAKRQEAEKKDEELRDRMLRQRLISEAKNAAVRQRNTERRTMMQEQAASVADARRKVFEDRWQHFEASRRKFAEKREYDRVLRSAEAERKHEKIERTKARCEEVQRAKILRTKQKEERVAQAVKEHERERAEELQAKADFERLQAQQRQRVYKEALAKQDAKVERLTAKIDATERHMKELQEESATEARLRRERRREIELDKTDCVARQRNADDFRRDQLEAKIAEKAKRVDSMKSQMAELKRRHQSLREEAERSRVHLEDPTPGPLEYDTLPHERDGPKWKFGLPASVLGARQISRTQPAAGYDASPGPTMYSPPRTANGPQYSMSRHERWKAAAALDLGPGPADYYPESPSPLRSPSRPGTSA